jgi:lysophospholipase L1-like esterase
LAACLVIGDSIAVGIGQFLPDCHVEARVGISAGRFVHEILTPQSARKAVISLGVNDGLAAVATARELRAVRRSTNSPIVYWVLPASHRDARAAIRMVAQEFGDRLIDAGPMAGEDGLHPTSAGYRTLASLVQ